jgi:hypothetical protein
VQKVAAIYLGFRDFGKHYSGDRVFEVLAIRMPGYLLTDIKRALLNKVVEKLTKVDDETKKPAKSRRRQ